MCVKEVEGALGQESPYRQEKACGGDGGGWRWRGPRLLADGCLLSAHTRRLEHERHARRASKYRSFPSYSEYRRNAESRCQSMHSEEVALNVYLHATALHRIQLCQV